METGKKTCRNKLTEQPNKYFIEIILISSKQNDNELTKRLEEQIRKEKTMMYYCFFFRNEGVFASSHADNHSSFFVLFFLSLFVCIFDPLALSNNNTYFIWIEEQNKKKIENMLRVPFERKIVQKFTINQTMKKVRKK